jgi:hypothetical protein
MGPCQALLRNSVIEKSGDAQQSDGRGHFSLATAPDEIAARREFMGMPKESV